jgi:hypothetical protein
VVEERKFAGGGGYFGGAAVAYLILAPNQTRLATETTHASSSQTRVSEYGNPYFSMISILVVVEAV